jgi:hypothetical protein
MIKYIFTSDSGHGWLHVTRDEIDRLEIAAKISPYSYQDRDMIFLEEDCDLGVFLEAKEARGEPVEFEERVVNGDAFIRSLAAYTP